MSVELSHNVYRQWAEGLISPQECLRALCSDLGEVESELGPLEQQKQALRNSIQEVVSVLGSRTEVAGFGMLALTSSGTRVTWDGKALDSLLAKLTQNGLFDIAEELAAARREIETAATLRITRERR